MFRRYRTAADAFPVVNDDSDVAILASSL